MLRYTKRGQADAGQASLLVLIILISIVLYVLLVPGEVREELLNPTNESGDGGSSSSSSVLKTLVDESPGTLQHVDSTDLEKNIPAFTISRITQAKELKRANSFHIETWLFGKKTRVVTFPISDLDHTDNVMVTFDSGTRRGMLMIKLNGELIYENKLQNYNADPVMLEKSMLGTDNRLEFYVSHPGLAFWSVNEYNIENLRILADFTDTSRQESQNTFLLTKDEKDYLERAYVKYNPNCNPDDTGYLYVTLNSADIFSGIPDCGMLNKHEIDPALLRVGENRLIFRTDGGNYLVDLITVEGDIKESHSPVYYFDLTDEDYDRITTGSYNMSVYMEFVSAGEWKEADLIVNGNKLRVDTKERTWKRVLDPYAQRDENSIKIVPDSTLELVKLTVKIEK